MKKLKLMAMMLIAFAGTALTSCSDDDDENGGAGLNRFAISQSSLTMTPGQKDTLTCSFFPADAQNKSVAWTSSNEGVATVDNNGVITAVAPGRDTITATPAGNPAEAKTCVVNVVMNQVRVHGSVEGTFQAFTTYVVDGQLRIDRGKSLTIEKGAQVIFNSNDGTAAKAGIEFFVEGNIYCNGTEDAPILFSIPESERNFDNVLSDNNLWGGFMLNNPDADAVALFDHCVIEYAGSPMVEGSPSVQAGIYEAGEDYGVQITTGPAFVGNLVVTDCVIRNGNQDGIYMENGNGIITRNTFVCNGATGGEAVNVKAGTKSVVAYNVMYSPNTNGLKLSSSGQGGNRGQSLCAAYNNTIINAGWRRDGEKGGCIYVEKNIHANVFNNLMVNCKFRAMTPSWGNASVDAGCDASSVIDYNCYVSGSVTSPFSQDQGSDLSGILTPFAGYNSKNKNYYPDAVDVHSIIAKGANDVNIAFANFDYDTNALDNMSYGDAWDLHLTAMPEGAVYGGSDLCDVQGGMGSLVSGITINGVTYRAEAPGQFYGAFGAAR